MLTWKERTNKKKRKEKYINKAFISIERLTVVTIYVIYSSVLVNWIVVIPSIRVRDTWKTSENPNL